MMEVVRTTVHPTFIAFYCAFNPSLNTVHRTEEEKLDTFKKYHSDEKSNFLIGLIQVFVVAL